MVGLPRSGKSTVASRLGGVVVSGDSIRLAMHGSPWNKLCESFIRPIQFVMVKALWLDGAQTIVIDDTNLTNIHRKRWLDWVYEQPRRPSFTFEYVGTPKSVCIERAKQTGQDRLVEIIEQMDRTAEIPDSPRDAGWRIWNR